MEYGGTGRLVPSPSTGRIAMPQDCAYLFDVTGFCVRRDMMIRMRQFDLINTLTFGKSCVVFSHGRLRIKSILLCTIVLFHRSFDVLNNVF